MQTANKQRDTCGLLTCSHVAMVTQTQSRVLQVPFSFEGTGSPSSSCGICLRGLARSETGLGSHQLESSRSECKLLFWHVHATEGFAKHFKNKQAFETKSCRNDFLWPGSS